MNGDYPQTWTLAQALFRQRGMDFHYLGAMNHRDRNYPDLASRLKHVLETMGWSQTELGRQLGCGPTTVNNWLIRNQGMDPKYAFALQDKHRWNARWLLEGIGPARIELVDEEAERLLARIRDLPPERRRALALLLESP